MLKPLLTLLVAFMTELLVGQPLPRTDSLALHAPEFKSIETLVEYCLKHIPKHEQSRFYFAWIANNVRYHHRFYEETPDSLRLMRLRPQVVFKQRRTICSGYSALLERLCSLSGIPNWEVKGYSVIGRDTAYHTWNLIREKEGWFLCDPTWGADFMLLDGPGPNSRAFGYFQSKPSLFATEHLPFDKNLSLIEPIPGFKTVGAFLDHEWALDSILRVWRSTKRGVECYPSDSTAKLEFGNIQFLLVEKNMTDAVVEYNKLLLENDNFTKPITKKKAAKILKQLEKIHQNAIANRLLNQQLNLLWPADIPSNKLKMGQREKFPGFIQAVEKLQQFVKKKAGLD